MEHYHVYTLGRAGESSKDDGEGAASMKRGKPRECGDQKSSEGSFKKKKCQMLVIMTLGKISIGLSKIYIIDKSDFRKVRSMEIPLE